MITIEKEGTGRCLQVSKAAYDIYYQNFGWVIRKDDAPPEDMEDEWEEADNEVLLSKPLSEMSREEMEKVAALKGISLEGLANNRQIREVLKGAI